VELVWTLLHELRDEENHRINTPLSFAAICICLWRDVLGASSHGHYTQLNMQSCVELENA